MFHNQNNKSIEGWRLPTPLVALLLLLLPALAIGLGGSGSNVEIPAATFSAGGGSHNAELVSNGEPIEVDFSVGLPMGTSGTGADGYSLISGFQSQREAVEQSTGPFDFLRGDSNGDGQVDVSDPVFILQELFGGGAQNCCADAGDANDDGNQNVADCISLLGYIFLAQPPPAAPFPDCGPDPTDDALECDSYNSC